MTLWGEQLIAGPLVIGMSHKFSGSATQLSWEIPNDPALIGLDVHAQGGCQSVPSTSHPKLLRVNGGLSNALDLILGF